ncbi:MAG: SDR family NAD(P)-dependent oxidoreductase [Methylovirgula sp.]
MARDFGVVVLAASSGEKLVEVGEQVKAIGAEPPVRKLDLMAATAAETGVKATADRFGRIDALVNIAGAVLGIDMLQMTNEQWNTGVDLTICGERRLTIHAWEAQKASKGTVFSSQTAQPRSPRARRLWVRSTRRSRR